MKTRGFHLVSRGDTLNVEVLPLEGDFSPYSERFQFIGNEDTLEGERLQMENRSVSISKLNTNKDVSYTLQM